MSQARRPDPGPREVGFRTFVGRPDFDDSTSTAEILGPTPRPVGGGKRPGKAQAQEVLALSGAGFQYAKFLTREQEVHLFRKMNFLKYQAARLQEAINPSRARFADLDRVDELLREAGAIRNRIICSYLGPYVAIARKWITDCQDFFDLVSEGNITLIRGGYLDDREQTIIVRRFGLNGDKQTLV